MGNEKPASANKKHLFQVEVLLEDASPVLALASLMQLLNHAKVKDFRITGGLELGQMIDAALANSSATPIAEKFPVAKPPQAKTSNSPASSGAKTPRVPESKDRLQQDLLEEYKERGTLIRLTIVKGKGVKLNMPCRILNFDPAGDLLTIYHVDEKRVYSFNLNEIEDIVAHNAQ